MPKKRCVCGRSQYYPLCDNTHEDENWSCRRDTQWAEFGFSASPALINYAHKLSAEFQGVFCEDPTAAYRVQTWLALVQSSQIQALLKLHAQVQAQRKMIVVIGERADFLKALFPEAQIYVLPDEAPVFQQLKQILQSDKTTLPEIQITSKPARIFVSHAVKDEPLIMPVMSELKQFYGADIFSCQDSISEGKVWHDEIMQALLHADHVVALISEAMCASTFCAFELGHALALNKKLSLISLDGSAPPSYIQHLHMINLQREAQLRPWLEPTELLNEQFLNWI